MTAISTYLNFARSTEEAFTFDKTAFGTEFVNCIMRRGDVPAPEAQSKPSDDDKQLVMNVQLPILGGPLLMGTDFPQSMGASRPGEQRLHLPPPGHTDPGRFLVRRAVRRGHRGGASSGDILGDYYGSLNDRFGVHWMINCSSQS